MGVWEYTNTHSFDRRNSPGCPFLFGQSNHCPRPFCSTPIFQHNCLRVRGAWLNIDQGHALYNWSADSILTTQKHSEGIIMIRVWYRLSATLWYTFDICTLWLYSRLYPWLQNFNLVRNCLNHGNVASYPSCSLAKWGLLMLFTWCELNFTSLKMVVAVLMCNGTASLTEADPLTNSNLSAKEST